jgi:hypothetical protein
MRSEFQVWRDEIENPRPTIAQRMAKWFDRPSSRPARDHFAWRDIAEALPINGEDA